MITSIVKYTNNWDLYPNQLFNCLDKETDTMLEDTGLPDSEYYPFPSSIGNYRDRYLRVIALRFVDACFTDKFDDMTKYGFKLVREYGSEKFWVR